MPTHPPETRLLSALPPADLARLLPQMADVTFGLKDVAHLPGGPVDYVYFPHSGMILGVVMDDGRSAEVAGDPYGCTQGVWLSGRDHRGRPRRRGTDTATAPGSPAGPNVGPVS